MAGPWFTVRETGSDWVTIDTITISNGAHTVSARVDIRMELEEPKDED